MMKYILCLFMCLLLCACTSEVVDVEPMDQAPAKEPQIPEKAPLTVQPEVPTQNDSQDVESETLGSDKDKNETETPVFTITLEDEKFSPNSIGVPKGTIITFKNARTQTRSDADSFLIGERDCKGIKTRIFGPGEEVQLLFDKEMEDCIIVDGIRLTQTVEISVT